MRSREVSREASRGMSAVVVADGRWVRAGVAAALLALLLPVISAPSAHASSCGLSGGGNATVPYKVATAGDLELVGDADCGLGSHYLQTADITMPDPSTTGGTNFTPISGTFTGVYDGGGFEIRNLKMTGGLFDVLDGTLKNIHLVNVDIESSSGYEGGLVNTAKGGRIEDSSVSGAVRRTGSGNATGGLVGYVDDPTTIMRSSSSATVEGHDRVGGLVGDGQGATIVQSFATGDVTGTEFVGGLVGGAAFGSGSITDSYALGDVEGDESVGGLIGDIDLNLHTVERSYSAGFVSAKISGEGGLIGTLEKALPNSVPDTSFWDQESSTQTVSAGGAVATAKSTGEMTTIGTFTGAGWAIVAGGVGGSSDVWGICPRVNFGYPFLLWQPIAADCTSAQNTGSASAPATGPSFVAPGGVVPALSAGVGALVSADGSSVDLAVSSPGVNQVRYAADGVEVTFTGGAGSDVSRGLVADPNGEVVCEVCVQLAAGQVIEVWMFSTPRLVAAHLTEDLPCQRFAVPVVAPLDGGGPVSAGAHTLQLALPTAQGMQAVNVGVTVGGPVPGSVPAGEGPAAPAGLVVFGLLAVAGGLLVARRPVVAG